MSSSEQEPRRLPRDEHNVSRKHISKAALNVLYTLRDAGYEGYLVGGGVRDLLLEGRPKDFDIATNAEPEKVQEIFGRQCRLIGRRFRLAHVRFGREIIEVATFRANHDNSSADQDESSQDGDTGRLLRDNVYGSMCDDAWRRDFTINALYYDINDFAVVDYVGGLEDIEARQIQLIGDPAQRYREDPVRMLRAVRFAAKLDFAIHADTEEPIFDLADLLDQIPAARLFDEVLKLFMAGHGVKTFELLGYYGLFECLFPAVEEYFDDENYTVSEKLVVAALQSTDKRIAESKPVTPAFLYASLLWPPVNDLAQQLQEEDDLNPTDALHEAADDILREQQQIVSIPRRFSTPMREIWVMQQRLESRAGRGRVLRLMEHPRFRAAYDFLVLRAEAGEADQAIANWWTELQDADEEQREQLLSQLKNTGNGRRRRRRPRNKSNSNSTPTDGGAADTGSANAE